jgi:hypothetical protein
MAAKRPALADFTARKAPAEPLPAPDPAAVPEAQEGGPRPVGRPKVHTDGRRGVIVRINHAAWKQLRQLALDEERPANDLMIEALNDLFRKHGRPPIG